MQWYQVLAIVFITAASVSVLFFLYLDKNIRW